MEPRPFLPSDRPRSGIHVDRAIIAAVKAAIDPTKVGGAAIAKKLWPSDPVTPLLLRAATSPTSTTSASALSIDTAIDFVGSLAPLSAAARLINAGMRVSLAGRNSVTIPRRQGGKAANNAAWIAQGSPIPIKQYVLDEATLGPTCKLALMVGLTNELAQYTAGQNVVSTLVREDLIASLDASMFSTASGANQPTGLLNGVTPLTASAATNKTDAMIEDLEKLAGSVLNAGGVSVVYIASPKQAAAAQLRLLTDATIWSCPALAPGSVIAVEPSAFVSIFGPEPHISASTEGAVHFEATTPLPIGASGTVASPTFSPFQSHMVIVRCILDAAWTMRAAGMVAVVNSVVWGAP